MRIVVFSDTHHNISRARRVIGNIPGITGVIHCGDVLTDLEELKNIFPNIDFYSVPGNCDVFQGDCEKLLEIEGKKIFITHGHRHNVKSENEIEYPTIRDRGRELGVDIVIFGHTHIPYNRNWGDIIVINPGSIKYEGTYGVIESDNGKLKTAILNVF